MNVPSIFTDPNALQAAIDAERARRSGANSFAAFVRQAWQFVPSCDPLVWGWHVDAICAHLEQVARGGISKLLTNIPPGHAKSVLQSVLWPAWVWTWWPQCQFLMASYSADLATRDSVRCRAVIESDWYRETHMIPGGWRLTSDQNAKDYFVNTVGGERLALGVGGTGRRAHIIGIDDPIDAVRVHSKAERDRTNEWIGQTVSQRFVDARQPRLAVVMQRLHAEDPSAFLLSGGDVEHLMLPTEFDDARRCVTYRRMPDGARVEFFRDPRVASGELLFPERFPAEVVSSFKLPNQLGLVGFATQHGQAPSPPGGGMFKVEHWRFWRTDEATMRRLGHVGGGRPRGVYDGPANLLVLDELEEVVLSVDATFRETTDGSYVAIHVWGRLGARRPLLYRVLRRMDFSTTVDEILRVIELFPAARRKLIEGKANGDAIISTLERRHGISGCEAVSPGTASKTARAHASQAYHVAGNLELPDGAPWVEEYIAEHAAFPNGLFDDDVDAESQAIVGLERPVGGLDAWANFDGVV